MSDPKEKLNILLNKQKKLLDAQRIESERLANEQAEKVKAETVQHALNQSLPPK